MSSTRWRIGDKVEWDHSQGTTRGTVVKVATTDGKIEAFHYVASDTDPRFIVESDVTGARAAHTGGELRRAR